MVLKKFEDNVEVKKYKVTPVKNRFVPDIVKFGRIQYPGVYELNEREVHRARHYGYLVEEIEEEKPDIPPERPETPESEWMLMGYGRIGRCRIY